MATLPTWPDFCAALGVDPFDPQAVVVGQSSLYHGPLFALQRCRKVGEKPNHEWVPDGDRLLVDNLSDEGGIFWRPACPGGHMDRHFTGSHLAFYEIDDLPLAGQWEALDRLTQLTGLTPAAVAFSGGKSLHVYYQLSTPLAADDWRRVMRKLAIAQNSDPAIVSLSRLMRLPGAKRFKNEQWVEQSIERLTPGAVYAPEDFEARLDGLGLWPHGLTDERWRLWRSQRGRYGHNAPALMQPDAVLFPPRVYTPIEPIAYDGQAIPLERCLSRRERDWLASGIPQGERNANGLVLGRSLVGTHDWLTRNGYRVDGHPEALWWDCMRASEGGYPYEPRELDTLWRQSTHGSPRPSLPDDALLACVQSVMKGNLPTANRPIAEWRRMNDEHRAKNPKNPNRPPQADRAKSQGFHRPSLADRLKSITDRLQNPLGKYRPNVVVNAPDLSQTLTPAKLPTQGVLVLLSPMGTGKTKVLALLIEAWLRVAAPGHRQVLQRGFGERLDCVFLNDADRFKGQKLGKDGQPTARLSFCWDSVLALNPADYPLGSYVLVLDEVDQGFLHLLLGGTCGKDGKRPALIARAIELIKNAGLVIMASADITEKDIDFVCSIRNEQPFILQNTYQRPGAFVDFYTGDSEIKGSDRAAKLTVLAKIWEAITIGKRIWVTVDTLKLSKEVERICLMAGISPDEILRFDGETSSDQKQRAFADSPNERAKDYRVVIANSSLTSGVSVEIDHFQIVFGLFTGSTIQPSDATQMLARVRQPVPRVVYARQYGKRSLLSRGKNALKAATDLLARTVDIATAIDDEGLITETDFSSPASVYVARAIADVNWAMADFALQIRLRLEADGHDVLANDPADGIAALEQDGAAIDAMAKTLRAEYESRKAAIASLPKTERKTARAELQDWYKQARRELWAITPGQLVGVWQLGQALPEIDEAIKIDDAQKIHSAPILAPDEAQKLRKKTHIGFDDRLALERFDLCNFYVIDPEKLSIDDVLWDDRSRKRRGIRRLEGLLWNGLDLQRDQKVVKGLRGWGQSLTAQDLPASTARLQAREKLDWRDVLARAKTQRWNADTPWVIEFAGRCLADPKNCDRAFGFWPNASQSPAAILGMALRCDGIKTKSRQVGTGCDRQRVYTIDSDDEAKVVAVLARRSEHHLQQGLEPHTHLLTWEYLGGVCVVADRLNEWVKDIAQDTPNDGPNDAPAMTPDEFEATMADLIAA